MKALTKFQSELLTALGNQGKESLYTVNRPAITDPADMFKERIQRNKEVDELLNEGYLQQTHRELSDKLTDIYAHEVRFFKLTEVGKVLFNHKGTVQ